MTKHEFKHYAKRKEKKSKIVMFTILFLILLILAGGLFFIRPLIVKNNYSTYNHFEFEQSGDYWQTYVQYGKYTTPITFYNHPLDIDYSYYNENITNYILEKPHSAFVIAIRDDAGSVPVIAGINIARILGEKFYGFKVSSALYFDDEMKNATNTTFPVVSCSDATLSQPVIFIDVNASTNEIDFDESNKNCIHLKTISSAKEDVLPIADLLVYKILEIM